MEQEAKGLAMTPLEQSLQQQLATVTNELCTAKDQIPPDMEGETLSVCLLKLTDARHDLQAQLTACEQERVRLVNANEAWHERVTSLKADLAAALLTIEELRKESGGRLLASIDLLTQRDTLQQTVARLEGEREAEHLLAEIRFTAIELHADERETLALRVTRLEEGLKWQCKFYCDWYDGKAYHGTDGGTIAYEIISKSRQLLQPPSTPGQETA